MSYPNANLISANLRTKKLGRNICRVEKTSSTNTLSKKLAREGVEDGTLVICREQTDGRGRGERTWHSDTENSICMSVILRPPIAPELLPRYTPAFAVASVRAMAKFGVNAEIKWPNDIVASGRKLCGILSEGGFYEDNYFIVCGIGINANMHFGSSRSYIDTCPNDGKELTKAAISIFDITGKKIQREDFVAEMLNEAERVFAMCEGDAEYAILLDEYAQHSLLLGREVTVYGKCEMYGIAVGFDGLGRLIVQTDEGEIVLDSGDVSVRLR